MNLRYSDNLFITLKNKKMEDILIMIVFIVCVRVRIIIKF